VTKIQTRILPGLATDRPKRRGRNPGPRVISEAQEVAPTHPAKAPPGLPDRAEVRAHRAALDQEAA